MSRNAALAGAARRVRSLAERVPESHRPNVAAAWAELLDAIEDAPDAKALALIARWQDEMEVRLRGTS